MKDQDTRGADERQIDELLRALSDAIRSKDARAVVALYTDDVVAYDLPPPLRIGSGPLHDPGYMQQWFDTWDGPIESRAEDLEIVVGGDVGYAFGLRHMTGIKKAGEHVDLWFRATACVRRTTRGWRIAHVHNSVPFAMDGSGRALLDLRP
jgi:PhnB protein